MIMRLSCHHEQLSYIGLKTCLQHMASMPGCKVYLSQLLKDLPRSKSCQLKLWKSVIVRVNDDLHTETFIQWMLTMAIITMICLNLSPANAAESESNAAMMCCIRCMLWQGNL